MPDIPDGAEGDDPGTRDQHLLKLKELADQLKCLNDPNVRDEIQQIRVRSMLQDFMSNDEIISSYDDLEVIDVYNDIVQLAPNLADNPTIMRLLIRRALIQLPCSLEVDPKSAGRSTLTGCPRFGVHLWSIMPPPLHAPDAS